MARSDFPAGFVDHLHSHQRLMMQGSASVRPLDPPSRQPGPTLDKMGLRRRSILLGLLLPPEPSRQCFLARRSNEVAGASVDPSKTHHVAPIRRGAEDRPIAQMKDPRLRTARG